MLSYNGRKVIPAPIVNINKVYNKSTAGGKLGVAYELTLTGTLLPWRGSPSGIYASLDSAFWTLSGDPPDENYVGNNEDFNHILRKQEALRWLFSQDGESLEWQPAGGQPVVKCNPKVLSINFIEGQWADRCEYTIALQADWIYINGVIQNEDNFDSNLIQSATESWEFSEEVGFGGSGYNISHNVNAVGIVGYDELGNKFNNQEAWENAAAWVNTRIDGTIDTTIISGTLGPSATGWIGGGYTKSITTSEEDGSYNVVETFVLMPSNTFTEKRFSFSQTTVDDTPEVSYDGVIYGISIGERVGGNQAIVNAKAQIPTNAAAKIEAETMFSNFLAANELSETPNRKSITVNQQDGTVAFDFTWTAFEDEEYGILYDATLNFDSTGGEYVLSLNVSIEGKGEDKATRLANARTAIPTDTEARTKALDLIDDQLPDDVTINDNLASKSTVVNESEGSIRLSYTWKGVDEELGNYSIEIQTNKPTPVIAIIPIPGRVEGPIVQNMNTLTVHTVTVNLRSPNNIAEPGDAAIATIMDDAAGATAAWILRSDRKTYDKVTKNYVRSRNYLVQP